MADIRGAVSRLRHDGASTIALVGASQGGSEALIAATRPPPGVTGLIALSADEITLPLAARPYPRTARGAAPRLRLPALFAVAAGDQYVSVTDTRGLFGRARSRIKRLVVLPASSGHGWDLVSAVLPGARHRSFADIIRQFLARVTS